MRQVLATATVLALLATGCAGEKEEPKAEGSSAAPPVALSGTVNDHGTKDLGSAKEVDVELDDFYFGPTFVKSAPGTTLTLELENEGEAPHTFTADGLTDTTVQPGQKAEATITLPASGAVRFYCKFHQGQGMQGAFFFNVGDTVAPAASPGTGTPSGTPSGATGDGDGAYGQ
jgi:plastocyanin